MARFARRLEDAEAAYLTPATERLRKENVATAARAEVAERLAVSEEHFAARLEETMRESRREHDFPSGERQRISATVGAA